MPTDPQIDDTTQETQRRDLPAALANTRASAGDPFNLAPSAPGAASNSIVIGRIGSGKTALFTGVIARTSKRTLALTLLASACAAHADVGLQQGVANGMTIVAATVLAVGQALAVLGVLALTIHVISSLRRRSASGCVTSTGKADSVATSEAAGASDRSTKSEQP